MTCFIYHGKDRRLCLSFRCLEDDEFTCFSTLADIGAGISEMRRICPVVLLLSSSEIFQPATMATRRPIVQAYIVEKIARVTLGLWCILLSANGIEVRFETEQDAVMAKLVLGA